MKTLIVLTAASGLMLTSALAQTATAPGANAPAPPSATQPMPNDQANAPANPAAAGGIQVITAQTSDDWLAGSFKGTDVLGSDNTKVGDVSDILFARDGKVLAYIVSVGGFLGMGAKDVAIAPSSFQVQPGQTATDFKLKVAMTKDDLKNAAAFQPYKAPAPTVGMGAPGANRPVGSTTRPVGSAQ